MEISKFLLKNTEKLGFLELPSSFFSKADLVEQDEIMVPLFLEDIKKTVTEKEGITILQTLKSLIYMMGVDGEFRFNPLYHKVIGSYMESPLTFISAYAGEAYSQKKLKDALIILTCGIRFFDADLPMHYHYAMIMKELLTHNFSDSLKKELYRTSKEEFEFILKSDPTYAPALYQSAYYDMNEKDFVSAKEKFEQAKRYLGEDGEIYEDIERQLSYIEGFFNKDRATELIEENKIDEAMDVLRRMKASTEIQEYQKNLLMGYCLRVSEEYEEAIEHLEKALQIDNQDPKLLTELGLCFMMIGDVYQSEQLYLAALDLSPYSVEILCNLGIINRNKGEFETALKYVRKALELDDKDEIAIVLWNELKHSYH